jgi:hypothetical protein
MERKWSLDNDVFGAQLTVDEMVNAINVFEVLKKKYPNDDIIDTAIEILREEICLMFGGSIYND